MLVLLCDSVGLVVVKESSKGQNFFFYSIVSSSNYLESQGRAQYVMDLLAAEGWST